MADYGYTRGGYKNGYETHSPGSGETGLAYKGEGHHDHVCKPVIVDALGRKRPIISYGPTPGQEHHTNGIVTKTEIIEQVHVPHGHHEGDGFIGKIKEAIRPHKTSPVSNPHWRQTSNSNRNYGSDYQHGSHGWNKHSGNTTHDPYSDGYQGKHRTEQDGSHEPAIITTGGWARPSHLGWAIPPNKEIPLTKPTNDIGTAIDYLQDAVKHTPASMAPAKPWSAISTPLVPTIDSREARRRYGSISESPTMVKTVDAYSSKIDSREAVQRYGGKLV